jgi:hypothetical protein
MTWYVEQLNRDGNVVSRVAVQVPTLRIGRALDNDVVLDDPHCAAYHARLDILDDGSANLVDLGTKNGILNSRNKHAPQHAMTTDEPYRLGQTQLRIRSSDWQIQAERILSKRIVWPIALLGLLLALGRTVWTTWLSDVQVKPPEYLYMVSGVAVFLFLWSAMYALFGRLVSGVQRFSSHLAIAAIGFLGLELVTKMLELLAFSTSWLWPLRIDTTVTIILVACIVRFHLRLADPRHWPTLRVGLAVVAFGAIIVPVAQLWISEQRLTHIQTINLIEYSSLRLANPKSIAEFDAQTISMKKNLDVARKNKDEDSVDDSDDTSEQTN